MDDKGAKIPETKYLLLFVADNMQIRTVLTYLFFIKLIIVFVCTS